MAGLMDRLVGVKAKQEGVIAKREAEEGGKAEQEARRGELGAERERVTAEIAATEQDAEEARSVLAEVTAMESRGELDEEMKTELVALKAEAEAKMREFEMLRARLAEIDQEIASLGVEAVGEAAPEIAVGGETSVDKGVDEGGIDTRTDQQKLEASLNEKFREFDRPHLEALQGRVDAALDELRKNPSEESIASMNRLIDELESKDAELSSFIDSTIEQIKGESYEVQARIKGVIFAAQFKLRNGLISGAVDGLRRLRRG